jgi:hypothetical protein
MKSIELDQVIEMSRRSIALQIQQLETLDKVFTAMQQHLDAQRKKNHLPRLVHSEVANDATRK